MYEKMSRDVNFRMAFFCIFCTFITMTIFQGGKNRDIAILVAILSIFAITSRNFFLPFLGETAFPVGTLDEREVEHAKINVEIPVPDDSTRPTRVIFWASNPNMGGEGPRETYGGYKNSGIKAIPENVTSVTVKIHCPSSYIVKRFGGKKHLKPHVHYRFAYDSGVLGKVNTARVLCVE